MLQVQNAGPESTMQPGQSLTTTLRDGTPVLIRPVVPGDAPLVALGFAQLSDDARQFRFLRAIHRLSDEDLWYFTHPDHRAHEAIGALDLSGAEPAPAGVARYVVEPDVPARAEVAITVIDRMQRLGLGTLLFGVLARIAVRRGLTQFVALVHSENRAMIDLLRDLGATRVANHGVEREYALPLHADPARYPATAAGDAFRAAYALDALCADA